MKVVGWILVFALIVVAGVGGAIFGAFGPLNPQAALPQTVSETRSTQIIESVTGEEQVVLLSLGIQGIEMKDAQSEWRWGIIPGSERKSYMMYSFKAKLGLEGKHVEIAEIAQNRFLVTIPDFIFIGHDEESFDSAIEMNGALSWVTEEIDPTEMVNTILGDESKQEYLASFEEDLREQTRDYYTGIVSSIDPTAVLEFKFL